MVGKEYADVVKMIEDLDADIKIKKDTSASYKYKKGLVVSVDEAGKSIEEGSTVTIIVSDGPGPDTEPEPSVNPETQTQPGQQSGQQSGQQLQQNPQSESQ